MSLISASSSTFRSLSVRSTFQEHPPSRPLRSRQVVDPEELNTDTVTSTTLDCSVHCSGRHTSTLTGSVTLTHATCTCSLAFGLSVETPPKATVFGSEEFADFLKIDPVMNIIAVLLGLLLNYGMGTIPSKRVQNFFESGLGWSGLLCGFAADYLQCRPCRPRENGP